MITEYVDAVDEMEHDGDTDNSGSFEFDDCCR